jgi:hypothetical protein
MVYGTCIKQRPEKLISFFLNFKGFKFHIFAFKIYSFLIAFVGRL